MTTTDIDATDKAIINRLQDGFPLCEAPFAAVATELGMGEAELIARIDSLLHRRILSRFGPMYDADRFGGYVTLAAMQIDEADFERVAELVNSFSEVAHNYRREHTFNMWFVVSAESRRQAEAVLDRIEAQSGLAVYNMPKEEEFYVGLKLAV